MAAAVFSAAAGGAYENYENYENYEICCWGAVCAALPSGNFAPEPKNTAAGKPTGYYMTPPSSSYKSYRSYKSYASVTPPQTAYPRCHQVAKPYPAVILGTLILYGCGGLQYRGGRRL